MNAVVLACVLSFGVGFLSLSQEILFVRLVSFAFTSTPEAFAFVLTVFLLGIAAGANIGKRICAQGCNLRHVACGVLLVAAASDLALPYLLVPLIAAEYPAPLLALVIGWSAAVKSVLFPVAHELGADSASSGRSISRVYGFNVIGSTAGPLVTGFILLDVVGLQQCLNLVALGSLTLAVLLAPKSRRALELAAIGALAWGSSHFVAPPDLLPDLISTQLRSGQQLGSIIENRSGIIHTIVDGKHGEMVFGGNVYDGRISTDLRTNSNGIDRAYILAALHDNPARVLVVGMSSGAWTWVVSRFPGVREIDVVEINPGYAELIRSHPEVAGILDDPRITIHVDDGRRWLLRHGSRRYDLIVMNTSFHWRAYATNLLSREFLTLVAKHLDHGGIVTFNTTWSPYAVWTAAQVFPVVMRYSNFVYASDHDFVSRIPSLSHRLYEITENHKPVFDQANPIDAQAIDKMFAGRFVTPQQIARLTDRPLEVITDDNMITEYRYGRPSRLIPTPF
jgi:spermidine synthase